ncbi:MAG: protein kinase domain-containing protein [Solirubrobacterales bacterium]
MSAEQRQVGPGDTIAGYRIEEQAGQGGMGTVFRATQLRPERTVALKVISPGLAQDPDFQERFEREAQLAAAIEHPNVVPVYEVGEEDGLLFLVMRWVKGPDLRSLLLNGPLEPGRAGRIVAQVAGALDAAHAAGLVHRDVKPANILVARAGSHDEHAYLTDFGLARLATSEGGPTKTGQWVGTVDFVAPEQIQGGDIDARADVYALGCVLYQAVAGAVPFPRDSDVAKMWAHLNENPTPLTESNPGITPSLDSVIERALAKDPADRFPSAGDLGRGAEAAAAGDDLPGTERTVARGAAAPATGLSDEAPDADRPSQRPTERPSGPPTDAGRPPATADTAPVSAKRGGPPKGLIAAGALLGVLVLLGVVGLVAGIGPLGSDSAGSVVGDPIPVGGDPNAIAVGEKAIWTADLADNTLTRIDKESGEVVGDPIKTGDEPSGVAVGAGSVWVAALGDGAVERYDPNTGRRQGDPIRVGGQPANVTLGFDAVWVPDFAGARVIRIDARSGKVTDRIKVGEGPIDIAIGAGSVWVANVEEDTLSRINPRSNRDSGEDIPVGQSPESVAFGGGSVWVTSIRGDVLRRVDPGTSQIAGEPIPVGERPDEVDADDDNVWVVNQDAGTLVRVDAKTAEVVGDPIEVGNRPSALAIGDPDIWVANFGADTVSRIDPGD